MNFVVLIYLFASTIASTKCDKNFYIVQRPDLVKKAFNVYWNIPTRDCKKHNIQFENLYEKYGIIQNINDSFHGEKISILYSPGLFPGFVDNRSINGVVPQEGNLFKHLQNFKKDVEETVPNENFNGIGIIDFENWRPILRQNFGTMQHIQELVLALEKLAHWWWPKQIIYREAQRRFESSARCFLQTTLNLAKKLRPKAVWGYYGFPECFNRFSGDPGKCPPEIPPDNNKLAWLWSESTALFPSVYSYENETTPEGLMKFIGARIKETVRVRRNGSPILPYFWFRYKDGNYLKENDLEAAISTFYNSNATGFIIWGSHKDVVNKSLCLKLKKYTTYVLGPTIAKYTKPLLANVNNITIAPSNIIKINSQHHFNLSESEDLSIESIVAEELKKQKKYKHCGTGSELVDVILDKIASYCTKNDCESKHVNSTEFISTKSISSADSKSTSENTSTKTVTDNSGTNADNISNSFNVATNTEEYIGKLNIRVDIDVSPSSVLKDSTTTYLSNLSLTLI